MGLSLKTLLPIKPKSPQMVVPGEQEYDQDDPTPVWPQLGEESPAIMSAPFQMIVVSREHEKIPDDMVLVWPQPDGKLPIISSCARMRKRKDADAVISMLVGATILPPNLRGSINDSAVAYVAVRGGWLPPDERPSIIGDCTHTLRRRGHYKATSDHARKHRQKISEILRGVASLPASLRDSINEGVRAYAMVHDLV